MGNQTPRFKLTLCHELVGSEPTVLSPPLRCESLLRFVLVGCILF